MVSTLAPELRYSGSKDSVHWCGFEVLDEDRFKSYVADRVKARVEDYEASDPFASDLRDLADSNAATEFVENLLRAAPEEQPWEIGEALAECVLTDDAEREIYWPWNLARDRRVPRASLPGADIIGLCKEGDTVSLLFGEVKTSSDAGAPPKVMYGRGGMAWQLKDEAMRLDLQLFSLTWLQARCQSNELRALYLAAADRYVNSLGKEILLIGVLLRDTEPNEKDVASRAKFLAEIIEMPTRAEIRAWYFPVPIGQWPALLRGAAT